MPYFKFLVHREDIILAKNRREAIEIYETMYPDAPRYRIGPATKDEIKRAINSGHIQSEDDQS